MPQHTTTFPANLVVKTTVPDTIQVQGVTVEAQLSFVAPSAPAASAIPGSATTPETLAPAAADPNEPQRRFHIPMWGWIVGGVILVLIIASIFFFGGSSKSHASTSGVKLDPVEDQIERGITSVEDGMADLSEAKNKLDKFGKKLNGGYETISQGLPQQPAATQQQPSTNSQQQQQPISADTSATSAL
jgi:hypothetical protein